MEVSYKYTNGMRNEDTQVELVKLQMQIAETTRDVAELQSKILDLTKQVIHLERQVDKLVLDIGPIKKIIYGIIAMILTAFMSGVIFLVMNR